jgi:precorrin-6B methylase 2
VTDLAERLVAGDEAVVRAGPFAGMTYASGRLPDIDAAVAKLLGVYEQEIAWVFERALELKVSTFVDVGCADGYYAVGMAHASPVATTYAYDLASSARQLCSATAAASRVLDRVRIGKRFTIDALESLPLADGALVLCDIEGGEVELLDSRAAALLARSVVVVEVHEDDRPGAGARVQDAFRRTHDVRTVPQEARQEAPAALAAWLPEEQRRALEEHRGPLLHWLVLEPRP